MEAPKNSTYNMEEIEDCLNQNNFDLINLLGKGGFCNCFLVNSRKYSQKFACKVIELPDAYDIIKKEYIKNEYNALTTIQNLNIVKLYKTFESKNYKYLILEYCTHGDLENYVKTHGPIKDVHELLHVFYMMLEPLTYFESHNIAHNDIKPSNFLIDVHKRIKLADFGLTKKLESEEDLCYHFIGSLPFLAPEIADRHGYMPIKADVWSFGITAFYLATGYYPFKCSNINELKHSQRLGLIVFPQNIHPIIREIILKCLNIIPTMRSSFAELFKLVQKTMPPKIQTQTKFIQVHASNYLKQFNKSCSVKNIRHSIGIKAANSTSSIQQIKICNLPVLKPARN